MKSSDIDINFEGLKMGGIEVGSEIVWLHFQWLKLKFCTPFPEDICFLDFVGRSLKPRTCFYLCKSANRMMFSVC